MELEASLRRLNEVRATGGSEDRIAIEIEIAHDPWNDVPQLEPTSEIRNEIIVDKQ